jgi:hypothetical protein
MDLKGHGFKACPEAQSKGVARVNFFVKGHDFSRAANVARIAGL